MWIALAATLALASDTPEPTVHDAVYHELSQRHASGCDALWSIGSEEEVRDALVTVASEATMPPWAPVNAARCLVPRFASDPIVEEQVKGWMSDPSLGGLALIVVQNLDEVEESSAIRIAELAVSRAESDSRFALYARQAFEASTHDALVSMAPRLASPPSVE